MLCSAVAVTGTLRRTYRSREASPSPVYGAALLMRLGFAPFRGSNPRASAPGQGACPEAQAPWQSFKAFTSGAVSRRRTPVLPLTITA